MAAGRGFVSELLPVQEVVRQEVTWSLAIATERLAWVLGRFMCIYIYIYFSDTIEMCKKKNLMIEMQKLA